MFTTISLVYMAFLLFLLFTSKGNECLGDFTITKGVVTLGVIQCLAIILLEGAH